jgi:hypothetical protein
MALRDRSSLDRRPGHRLDVGTGVRAHRPMLGVGYWLGPETAVDHPASADSTSTDATGPT